MLLASFVYLYSKFKRKNFKIFIFFLSNPFPEYPPMLINNISFSSSHLLTLLPSSCILEKVLYILGARGSVTQKIPLSLEFTQ